ncbi:MAG: flagellar motor protein [Gammaproteobacteria bacterium]|nr:MAG: flagellar motor protein [Gammaproteobacteria bacterium]
MDSLSLLGITIGLLALVGGNWLEGGSLNTLANGPALVIVLGGTVGAVLLQTPGRVFLQAMRQLKYLVVPPRHPFDERIKRMVTWAQLARHDGLLGLEKVLGKEKDPFARKGLQLVVDGNEPEDVRRMLELELDSHEQHGLQAARVFESMGGYSPTIGIIGAVMGLIQVMQNLAEPAMLGSGIATAFVATIYGVGLANLLLLPAANKLRAHVLNESHYRELIIEGLVAIAEGENPRMIDIRLRGFVH